MNKILQHYAGYICHFSKRQVCDEFGNISYRVDEDIWEQIEAKLMAQIVIKFNCASLPDGETLTDNLSQVGAVDKVPVPLFRAGKWQ